MKYPLLKPHYIFIVLIALLHIQCNKENQKPTIEIVTPAVDSQFTIGEIINISANASDPDGTVSEVRFYFDNVSLGNLVSIPYAYSMSTNNYAVGQHIIRVDVIDDEAEMASTEIVIELIPVVVTPIASFTANPVEGEAPLLITFEDLSQNSPTDWKWDFGDGDTSIESDPEHFYDEIGCYSVELIVSNSAGGDTIIMEDLITVANPGGGNHCPGMPNVSDIDGNLYNTVQIGDQCWMKENLKVIHYPNGSNIPNVTENDDWAALADNNTDDAYCYHNNNPSSEFGVYYTFAAAIADNWENDNDANQGICPDGWHLPSDTDWDNLLIFLIANGYNWDGSTSGNKVGKALASTYGWDSHELEGRVGNDIMTNNSSGFTALPTSSRSISDGSFNVTGSWCDWWVAYEQDETFAGFQYISSADERSRWVPCNKSYGMQVRCIRND